MITAIILTLNEGAHIARCIRSLSGVASRIVVVDTGSTDDTCEIARQEGVEVRHKKWLGNQADTFNAAVSGLEITTPWVLRIDADEYLTEGLRAEICRRLPEAGPEVSGIYIRRRKWFCGKELRHGAGRTVAMLRLVRKEMARYPKGSLMDEKYDVPRGSALTFKGLMMEETLHDIARFKSKHLDYATREARQTLEGKTDTRGKRLYYSMPGWLRPWAYFVWRYLLSGGFLDGRAGWKWDTLQCLWYRRQVEKEIKRLRPAGR